MSDESLPQLTVAPIPAQTHILHLDKRVAQGKALRDAAGRRSQGEWQPPAARRNPVDLLVESSAHEKEFAKLTMEAGDTPRIVDQPPLIFHYGDERDQEMRVEAQKALVTYKETLSPSRRLLLDRFEMVDYAIKVVGVGSVGTFCGIILLMSGNGDPLFLQFKEARQSVLEPYCGKAPFTHAGQRVVVGQRSMQAASDIFLGWTTGAGAAKRHFFTRQLSDAKIKPVVEIMNPANLKGYAQLCGTALARAHARPTHHHK